VFTNHNSIPKLKKSPRVLVMVRTQVALLGYTTHLMFSIGPHTHTHTQRMGSSTKAAKSTKITLSLARLSCTSEHHVSCITFYNYFKRRPCDVCYNRSEYTLFYSSKSCSQTALTRRKFSSMVVFVSFTITS